MLEDAGLVQSGRDAQRRPRRLDPRLLAEATRWLEQHQGARSLDTCVALFSSDEVERMRPLRLQTHR